MLTPLEKRYFSHQNLRYDDDATNITELQDERRRISKGNTGLSRIVSMLIIHRMCFQDLPIPN